MGLAKTIRNICPELATFLDKCCAAPLRFEGDCPNLHSSHNHIHLWALEYWADRHDWIDLDFRTEFVEEILEQWRVRLKGLPPYRNDGYRVYLYEDLAPTVSVVAETAEGFPYPGEPTFVNLRRNVMELYVDRSWQSNFHFEPIEVDQESILKIVEANSGSISKPTANALGVKVGALRRLIEQMDLQREINAIRKKYKRRPAKFSEHEHPHRYRIHEQLLRPGYH